MADAGGMASGAASGAAAGSVFGPVGTVVGGLVGALGSSGGLLGGGSTPGTAISGQVSFGDFNVQSRNSRSSPWPYVALAAVAAVLVAVLFWPRRSKRK